MKQRLFLLVLVFTVGTTYSQPGSLDQTFGNNGFVADDGISVHFAIVQQKDGKLVTAGGYSDAKFNGKGNLARFLPDGTIDSSFGVNGYVSSTCSPYDMIMQSDGKMLTVGSIRMQGSVSRNCIERLKPDGTSDSSFGVNGIALIPDFQDNDNPYNRIRQAPDGSIVITGSGFATDRQEVYSFISHLSADGVFDAKFGGTNGRVINHTSLSNEGLAIQKDGRILLAGYSHSIYDEHNLYPQPYVLSRYTPDGRPDETFGTNGTVITEGLPGIEGYDLPGGIVVQPDGKIVVGGTSMDYNIIADMVALRYNTDGTLDNNFGTNGRAYVSFDGKSAGVSTVLLQPDGKFVLSGGVSNLTETDLALSRLTTDGTLDSSFAIDGRQVTPFSGGDAGATCALLQFDGKIVQGGDYFNEEQNFNSYLLARYNNDSKGQLPLVARLKRYLHNHGIGWQGLDNSNLNYYSVQYSKTGSGFTEKGKVSGSGSSIYQQYNYNVNDAGYYRVVAVDRKGYKTFSNKVMMSADDVASAASVYPNPARDYVVVKGLPLSSTANVSISDGSGTVRVKNVSSGSGEYRSSLNNLQPGTYYVNITTNGKTEVVKFVKE